MNPLKKFSILVSVCLDACACDCDIIKKVLNSIMMISLVFVTLYCSMYYLVSPLYVWLIEIGYCSIILTSINHCVEENSQLLNETILTLPIADQISILRQHDLIDWNYHETVFSLMLLLVVTIVLNLCSAFILICPFHREGYNLKDKHLVMIYIMVSFGLWLGGLFLVEIIIIPPFVTIPVGVIIIIFYDFLYQFVTFCRNVQDKYNEQIRKTIV